MTNACLITGLPRSRTAWLSVAATGYKSMFYHEPYDQLSRWQDIGRIWSGSRYLYTGIADSAMGFHLAEILERWGPRTLIVERAPDAVEASLARAFPGVLATNYVRLLDSALGAVGEHPLILRVRFDELNNTGAVWRALRHMMPEAKLDIDKIKGLMRLNVQAVVSKVLEDASARAHEIGRLIGQDVVDMLRPTG